MLEVLPFMGNEMIIVVHWGSAGRWLVIDQVGPVVFGWTSDTLRHKLLFDGIKHSYTPQILRVTDKKLLDKLIKLNLVKKSAKEVHLVHLASLDIFLKNFAKRSRFTNFYDLIHNLQWGKADESGPRKRSLTAADKKHVACLQDWKYAHCRASLPARFEVDHIIPWADGGSDAVENLQALCANCHSNKTDMDRMAKSAEKARFNAAVQQTHSSPLSSLSGQSLWKPSPLNENNENMMMRADETAVFEGQNDDETLILKNGPSTDSCDDTDDMDTTYAITKDITSNYFYESAVTVPLQDPQDEKEFLDFQLGVSKPPLDIVDISDSESLSDYDIPVHLKQEEEQETRMNDVIRKVDLMASSCPCTPSISQPSSQKSLHTTSTNSLNGAGMNMGELGSKNGDLLQSCSNPFILSRTQLSSQKKDSRMNLKEVHSSKASRRGSTTARKPIGANFDFSKFEASSSSSPSLLILLSTSSSASSSPVRTPLKILNPNHGLPSQIHGMHSKTILNSKPSKSIPHNEASNSSSSNSNSGSSFREVYPLNGVPMSEEHANYLNKLKTLQQQSRASSQSASHVSSSPSS